MIKRTSVFGRYSLFALGLIVCLIGVVLVQSIRARRVWPKQGDTPPVSVNAGTGTQNVIILGTAVWLSPPRLTFGSSPQRVTVTNGGTSTLHLSQIEIVGANAGDFSKTTTCGSTLAVGANCTVSVTFKPKACGARAASLLFRDDARGSPQAVGLTGTGQFMVLDQTKSYLVNTFTGKPVFIMGEQASNLNVELSADSDIDLYLSTRQAQGFNFIWVGATDMGNHDNAPYNGLGQAPFGPTPFTGMNEAYFEHLDYVLQRATAYGFEVLLMPAFVGSGSSYCSDSTGWCLELQAAANSDLTNFGAYLGNRYKNYPNIIWVLGGDLDLVAYPNLQAKMEAILTGIQSTDPNHMITIENEPGTTGPNSQDYNGGSAWPSGAWNLDFLYDNASTMASDADSAWTRTDHLPTFLGEDVLEGESSSPSDPGERTEKYQAVLGGTTLGFVFGNCVMWALGYHYTYCSSWTSSTQWKTWFNTAGATASMYLGKLMRSREFWKMVPDTSHTVVTAGYGSGDTITVTSRSSDGQTIIAYIPKGNAATLTVDMSKVTSSSNTAKCWWFNPSSGATTLIGSYANSGTQDFTPPDSNDRVLVIDDADANLPAPGSANL